MLRHSELVGGLFWVAVGLVLLFWSSTYQVGTFSQPGPGLFPLTLGILLLVVSVILLTQARKSSSRVKDGASSLSRGRWRKVAYSIFSLALATFIFEKVGYLITTFLMIFLVMSATGPRNWKAILLVAFLSAAGVYLVFVLILKQPFPSGLLRI